MFDILQSANTIFGTMASSCKEIFPEFSCEYRVEGIKLPTSEDLNTFIEQTPKRDKMTITITSDTGNVFSSDDSWIDSYNSFISGVYGDEDIIVSINVTKNIEAGKLSIYNKEKFSEFLASQKKEQVLEAFSNLFKKCGSKIHFQLLDTNGSLRTNSIAFSDNDVRWMERYSREEAIKACEDSSVFLDRARIRLVPQDFEINSLEGKGFDTIIQIFKNLQTILVYIYLANTATVTNNKAILQFDPVAKGYEYELTELATNQVVPEIYDWIYMDRSCVDKACIARRIINTYCRDKDSILEIDETLLNSIKSDYIIYQKNHADQYIDMKNKISEYIVNCAEKIQNLSHDITDAFRNNFVAIIVFIMTVLLTDAIDFSAFLESGISPKVTAVCVIFTVSTILYFIATIIMCNQKWDWLKQSYGDLKTNYNGVFDKNDIEEAFNYDIPLKNAEKQYKEIRKRIGTIWSVLILVLMIFTGILFWQGRCDTNKKMNLTENASDFSEIAATASTQE